MSCGICGDSNVYNAKRQLCRKCYGNYYRAYRVKDRMTLTQEKELFLHDRELEFIDNYFKHTNWVYSPANFRLNTFRYSPDFYDGEANVFIEVVGSRQAYHQNKIAYAQFRELYPKIKLEIRKISGELLNEENSRMDWTFVPKKLTVKEVKKNIQMKIML